MDEFEVLTSVSGGKVTKMAAKGVEVDVIPGFVAPSMVSLDVVAVMVPVDMEPNTLIILIGHRSSINIERDLLVDPMSNS